MADFLSEQFPVDPRFTGQDTGQNLQQQNINPNLGTTANKQQAIRALTKFKQTQLSGDDRYLQAADTEAQHDVDTAPIMNMSDEQLVQRFGAVLGRQLAGARAERNLAQRNLANQQAVLSQQGVLENPIRNIGDFTGSVGQGLSNAVLGVGAFGAGLVNENAGKAIYDLNNNITQGIQGLKSTRSQQEAQISQRINALQDQDAEDEYNRTGNLGQYLLSTAGNAVKQAFYSPTTAIDIGGQAIGSIAPQIAAAGLTGGASSAATASKIGSLMNASKAAQAAGDIDKATRLASQASQLSKTANRIQHASTVASGLVQGAGEGYINTHQNMDQLSDEYLEQNVPAYNNLINSGYSSQEARNILANEAGLKAAPFTALSNAVGTHFTLPFLKNPLNRVTRGPLGNAVQQTIQQAPNTFTRALADLGKNTIKETLEEAAQGAASQISSNIASQQTFQPDLSAFEGVGQQIGQGAVGGGLAAGGLGLPGTAFRAIFRGNPGYTKTIENLNNISQKIDNSQHTVDEDAPAQSSTIDKAVGTIKDTVGKVVNKVSKPDENIPTEDITNKETNLNKAPLETTKPITEDDIDLSKDDEFYKDQDKASNSVKNRTDVDTLYQKAKAYNLVDNNIKEQVKQITGNTPTNPAEVMGYLDDYRNNETDPNKKIQAVKLLDNYRNNTLDLMSELKDSNIENFPTKDQRDKDLKKYLLDTQKSFNNAFTPELLKTDPIAQAVSDGTLQNSTEGENVLIDALKKHPERLAGLDNASLKQIQQVGEPSIANSARLLELVNDDEVSNKNNSNSSSKDNINNTASSDWIAPKSKNLLSLNDHIKGLFSLSNPERNKATALKRILSFRNYVQSIVNAANAMNKSTGASDKQPYRFYTGSTGRKGDLSTEWDTRTNFNANQRVLEELSNKAANAVEAYNRFVNGDKYKFLNLKQMQRPKLIALQKSNPKLANSLYTRMDSVTNRKGKFHEQKYTSENTINPILKEANQLDQAIDNIKTVSNYEGAVDKANSLYEQYNKNKDSDEIIGSYKSSVEAKFNSIEDKLNKLSTKYNKESFKLSNTSNIENKPSTEPSKVEEDNSTKKEKKAPTTQNKGNEEMSTNKEAEALGYTVKDNRISRKDTVPSEKKPEKGHQLNAQRSLLHQLKEKILTNKDINKDSIDEYRNQLRNIGENIRDANKDNVSKEYIDALRNSYKEAQNLIKQADNKFNDNPIKEETRIQLPIQLNGNSVFLKKDQNKANLANKYIGRGSENSSTNRYAKDFGSLANTGSYNNNDVVFISAEGARRNRLVPDYAEIQKALDAKATIVTDKLSDRKRSYNVGEREVASYLQRNNYIEDEPGIWKPIKIKDKGTEVTLQKNRDINPNKIEDTNIPASTSIQEDSGSNEATETSDLPEELIDTPEEDVSIEPESAGKEEYNIPIDYLDEPNNKRDQRLLNIVGKALQFNTQKTLMFQEDQINKNINMNFTEKDVFGNKELLDNFNKLVSEIKSKFYPAMHNPIADAKKEFDEAYKKYGNDVLRKVPKFGPLIFNIGKGIQYDGPVLAASGWSLMDALTSSLFMPKIDPSDVFADMGLSRNTLIDQDGRNALRIGANRAALSSVIENSFKNILGLNYDSKEPNYKHKAIILSMVGNIIEGAVNAGLLIPTEVNYFENPNEQTPKTLTVYVPNSSVKLSSFGGSLDLFTKNIVPTKPNYQVGKPIENINSNVRGSYVKLSKKYREALKAYQDRAFKFHPSIYNLLNNGSAEQIRDLFGLKIYNSDKAYEPYKATIDGKNTLASMILNFMNLKYTEAENYAKNNSIDKPEDVPIYFKARIGRDSRYHNEGFNPASNKELRSLMPCTWNDIDLNNPEHNQAMLVATAEGLGIKVDKQTIDQTLNQLREKLNDSQVTTWLDDIRNNKLPTNISLEELHALVNYNDWKNARARGDSTHHTSAYITIDGLTNGVSNSVAFWSDSLDSTFVNLSNKAGRFFNQPDMDSIKYKQQGNKDFYETVANEGKQFLLSNIIKENNLQSISNYDQLLRLLNNTGYLVFNNPINNNTNIINEIKNGSLDFNLTRDFYKKPVTQKSYMAGDYTLSVTMEEGVVDAINKNIWDHLQNDGTIETAPIFEGLNKNTINELLNPDKNEGEFSRYLTNAFMHLSEAAQDILPYKNQTTTYAAAANLLQFHYALVDAGNTLTKASNWLDESPDEEVKRIKKSLKKVPLNIKSGFTNIGLVPFEKNYITQGYSSIGSLSGKTNIWPSSPNISKEYTVASVPLSVIGLGDARILTQMLPEMSRNVLTTHDGLHSPLGSYKEIGTKLNDLVSKDWNSNPLINPMDQLIKGLEKFSLYLKNKNIEDFTPEQLKIVEGELPLVLENAKETLEKQGIKIGTKELLPFINSIVENQKDKLNILRSNIKNMSIELNYIPQTVDQYVANNVSYQYMPKDNVSLDEYPIKDISPNRDASGKIIGYVNNQTGKVYSNIKDINKLKILSKNLYINELNDFINKGTNEGEDLQDVSNKSIDITNKLLDNYQPNLYSIDPNKVHILTNLEGQGKGTYNPVTGDINVLFTPDWQQTLNHELMHAVTFPAFVEFYRNNKIGNNPHINLLDKIFNKIKEDKPEEFHNLLLDINRSEQIALENKQNITKPIRNALALSEFVSHILSNPEYREVKYNIPAIKNWKTRLLDAFKKLIGFLAPGLDNKINDFISNTDAVNNIQFVFNTMKSNPTEISEETTNDIANADITLFSTKDERKQDIQQKYQTITDGLTNQIYNLKNNAVLVNHKVTKIDYPLGLVNYTDSVNNGFVSNINDAQQFAQLYAILQNRSLLKSGNINDFSNLIEQFMDNVKPSDFSNQQQYDYIMGLKSNDIIPVLGSLSIVSDDFVNAFNNVLLRSKPKKEKIKPTLESINSTIENVVDSALETQRNLINNGKLKDYKNRDVLKSLDQLLVSNDVLSRLPRFASLPNQGYNWANDKINKIVQDATDRLNNKITNAKSGINSKYGKVPLSSLSLALNLMNDETRGYIGDGLSSWLRSEDNMPTAIKEFWTELRGTTPDTYKIYASIKNIKGFVEGLRQRYREDLPTILNDMFEGKLNDKDWELVTKTLNKTGLLNRTPNTFKDIMDNPSDIQNKIQALEAKLDPNKVKKVNELVQYLTTGKLTTNNLLKNAHMIESSFGEVNMNSVYRPQQVNIISRLLSLKTYDALPKEDKKAIEKLYNDNREAFLKLNSNSFEINKDISNTQIKSTNQMGFINSWFGYTPSEPLKSTDTREIIIGKMDDEKRYKNLGYEFVKPYKGLEGINPDKLGYFKSVTGYKAKLQQGALQLVKGTFKGANVENGTSVDRDKVGLIITDKNQIKAIQNGSKTINNSEGFIPVYDSYGNVKAYEVMIDPSLTETIPTEQRFNHILGMVKGRQVEEQAVKLNNTDVVDNLKNMFDKASTVSKKEEFINIADPKVKKTIKDVWDMIPRETKQYIKQAFGDDNTFYVRKDLVNNVIGYKNFSVTDFMTGSTNYSKEAQSLITNIYKAFLGDKAYKYLKNSEGNFGDAIKGAKDIIVNRYYKVPLNNMIANAFQLYTRGIPAGVIYKEFLNKYKEISEYNRLRKELINIETINRGLKINTDPNSKLKIQRLNKKAELINDTIKNFSINPLLEKGEYSSVTSSMIGDRDDYTGGKFIEMMENAVNKIPNEQLRVLSKYGIMSEDTAMYKLMMKMNNYGDFIAKSIYYDYLKSKGLSDKDAHIQVMDEFINYDTNPGRLRSYTDSMGITWFFNYKLRSMKIALNLLTKNPLSVLMTNGIMTQIPGMNISNPYSDNIIGKLFTGGLSYSTGLGMLKSAPFLLPFTMWL